MTTYCELFNPLPGGEIGVLLPNHLASSIHGDTGFRAQCLGEATGLPVVAYERPSTATQDRQAQFTIEGYRQSVEERSQELCRYMGNIGITELIIAGNSAAGLEAFAMGLSLARANNIIIRGILSLEPVGMRNTNDDSDIGTGDREMWQYFKGEMEPDKTEIDDPEYRSLPRIEAPERSLRENVGMVKNVWKEFVTYKTIYSSDVGMRLLGDLAREYPDIPVQLVLGNRSKATTPALRTAIESEFADTSVKTKFLPAAHSFPNRHEVFIHEFKKFMLSLTG